MLLKVEVYDKEPSGDFHAFNLAIPKVDLRTIGTVKHDKTRKLVIGTLTYNVLVTSAIDLSSCSISVGADSSLHVSENSQMWARKDKELNPLLLRQVRSRYDCKSTFFQCASVYCNFCLESLPRHRPGPMELPRQGEDHDGLERNSQAVLRYVRSNPQLESIIWLSSSATRTQFLEQ
ncbi:MAG: hypothetical protein J3Q66DRAFT_149726 [Benniella sp.]|nr:MAG: hypothetical protein J3Q66DRAFT_149726 [Benniella sp.]